MALSKQPSQLNQLLCEAMALYGIKSFAFTFYTQFPTSQGNIQYSYIDARNETIRGWVPDKNLTQR